MEPFSSKRLKTTHSTTDSQQRLITTYIQEGENSENQLHFSNQPLSRNLNSTGHVSASGALAASSFKDINDNLAMKKLQEERDFLKRQLDSVSG